MLLDSRERAKTDPSSGTSTPGAPQGPLSHGEQRAKAAVKLAARAERKREYEARLATGQVPEQNAQKAPDAVLQEQATASELSIPNLESDGGTPHVK